MELGFRRIIRNFADKKDREEFYHELNKKNNLNANRSESSRINLNSKFLWLVWLLVIILYFFIADIASAQSAAQLPAQEENYLISFSDPSRLWGNGIEKVIEEAYRQFFRTKIIDGKVMNIRIPFAMNNDRDVMIRNNIFYFGDGKASPQMIWPVIEEILNSKDFSEYIKALSSGREKVIIFDIPERKWSVQTDLFLIAQIKSGAYKGLPHRPYALTSGKGALESDVYNYLYCIGYTGIDCSGFVWNILSHIGRAGGVNLGEELRTVLGTPRNADPSRYAGTSFFNSRSNHIIAVNDDIRSLRPADVMLFRDIDGAIVHSAIIQSIDRTKGVIRYLQCNNVAPINERGVHEAFIYFDPSNQSVSLKDPSLHWTKKRFGAFTGEDIPFADDGERYRYRLNGGGRVVRIRALIPAIERLNRQ